jgi:hypothetical protein
LTKLNPGNLVVFIAEHVTSWAKLQSVGDSGGDIGGDNDRWGRGSWSFALEKHTSVDDAPLAFRKPLA